jgi:hypothetical protein
MHGKRRTTPSGTEMAEFPRNLSGRRRYAKRDPRVLLGRSLPFSSARGRRGPLAGMNLPARRKRSIVMDSGGRPAGGSGRVTDRGRVCQISQWRVPVVLMRNGFIRCRRVFLSISLSMGKMTGRSFARRLERVYQAKSRFRRKQWAVRHGAQKRVAGRKQQFPRIQVRKTGGAWEALPPADLPLLRASGG